LLFELRISFFRCCCTVPLRANNSTVFFVCLKRSWGQSLLVSTMSTTGMLQRNKSWLKTESKKTHSKNFLEVSEDFLVKRVKPWMAT
jgi:hypothetical protein